MPGRKRTSDFRLPDEENGIRVLRQEYARARSAWEAEPSLENVRTLRGVEGRRARAMRSLARDDGATVRDIAALFRCSKTVVRAALEQEA